MLEISHFDFFGLTKPHAELRSPNTVISSSVAKKSVCSHMHIKTI